MAAFTNVGERSASEIVILICHVLLFRGWQSALHRRQFHRRRLSGQAGPLLSNPMQQSDKATGLRYAFRSGFLARECNYQIGLAAVHWTSGNRRGCIDFSDVQEVHLYRQFMPGEHALNRNIMWRVHLRCHSGN